MLLAGLSELPALSNDCGAATSVSVLPVVTISLLKKERISLVLGVRLIRLLLVSSRGWFLCKTCVYNTERASGHRQTQRVFPVEFLASLQHIIGNVWKTSMSCPFLMHVLLCCLISSLLILHLHHKVFNSAS